MVERSTAYILRDKVRGCLIGTAAGDALGMPVEGWNRDDIKKYYGRITQFLSSASRYSKGLGPGYWTDDTKLTIAVAEGIYDACFEKEFTPDSVRKKVLTHHLEALRDHAKRGFGRSTREALEDWRDGKDPFDGRHPKRPGNGCAMKMAIVGVFSELLSYFGRASESGGEIALAISSLTHNDSRSLVAGAMQAFLAAAMLRGWDFSENRMYNTLIWWVEHYENKVNGKIDWPRVSEVLKKAYLLLHSNDELIADTLKTSGAAFESFPTALIYALKYKDNFRAAVEAGANAGGDTDTIAAMTGALVGTKLGYDAIPQEFLENLEARDYILDLSDRLWGVAAWVGFNPINLSR